MARQSATTFLALIVAFSFSCRINAEEPTRILWSVDWTAKGERFAVGGEKALWLYDANTFARLASLPIGVGVNSVSWHPTGKLIAIAARSEDTTGVFDFNLKLVADFKTAEGTRDIAWNHDGTLLATAGNDGSMQVWTHDGTLLHTAKPKNSKSLTGVAWHPKQNRIISIGETIRLFDDQGHLLNDVRHRPKANGMCLLLSVAWHPSGEFFAVSDYGNSDTNDLPVIQVWSPDLKLLRTMSPNTSAEVRRLAWTADGMRLASASDSLRIWS